VAVDGAGDVFIADTYNNRVVEVPWTGSGFGAEITLPASGLNDPYGVAVDTAGDVFIMDTYNNRLVELPWTGSGYGAQITLPASGLINPYGVAVDTAGDVFIANTRWSRRHRKPLKTVEIIGRPNLPGRLKPLEGLLLGSGLLTVDC
jgi:serine/threonine protein kinase, bacterial